MIKNIFLYSPGGGEESGSDTSVDKDLLKETTADGAKENLPEEEDKSLGEKIKEALQDWSNKDQQDQDFDDTRV